MWLININQMENKWNRWAQKNTWWRELEIEMKNMGRRWSKLYEMVAHIRVWYEWIEDCCFDSWLRTSIGGKLLSQPGVEFRMSSQYLIKCSYGVHKSKASDNKSPPPGLHAAALFATNRQKKWQNKSFWHLITRSAPSTDMYLQG